MADDDLPYRGEYAKSGRASCKSCKDTIAKGDLRLAAMVQSPMFDGKTPSWFHLKCFFKTNRVKSVDDIAHFQSLRWEDQELITKKLENSLSGKGTQNHLSKNGTLLADFRIEYSISGGATCKICEQKIKKNVVRIGKKDYDSQRAKMYGPFERWTHVECFASNRREFEFFDGGDKINGLNTLSADDQAIVKRALVKLESIKRKVEDETSSVDSKKVKKNEEEKTKQKEAIKKQMKKLYYFRDLLQKHLKKKEMEDLLEFNEQEVPKGAELILDCLSDVMTFGSLDRCAECSNGQLLFRSGVGYVCTGDISEWTKCQFSTLKPSRRPFNVPPDYAKVHSFLAIYKYRPLQRIISTLVSRKSISHETSGLLKDLSFVLVGDLEKMELKQRIVEMGGLVETFVTPKTAAVIADSDSLVSMGEQISLAKEYGIQVVSPGVLDNVVTEGIISQIRCHTICEWGKDPQIRLGDFLCHKNAEADTKSQSIAKSAEAMFTSGMPKSIKLKLKGDSYVDPDSGLDHKAHVLKSRDALYSVVLGTVNIKEGKNSYYKLQVLQHDKKSSKFYVFRSWGRVGTTIGGTKLENFEDRSEALRCFECLYEEKTGNRWKNRSNFQKVAGKFFPLDIDFGPQDDVKVGKNKLSTFGSKSKLPKPIQELVSHIFDVEKMMKVMVEFEIDLTKMPLGKISRKQIESAYNILSSLLDALRNQSGTKTDFLDGSNKFFTLIPHDFGMKTPPVLDNPDYIKNKINMLDNLLEIEIAYSLLRSSNSVDDDVDPIDASYQSLNTEISLVDCASEEYKLLQGCVANTHASTHNNYTLEILHIFKIVRKGEAKRFKAFKKMQNRTLLWHGSRSTNFAGILSKGLRIAPPEAPTTGYMFGKGIYFADMVSKSANYCCTTRSNNTGFLLLCDVALGNMYERTQADYIEKLPPGMHSTKGLGKTEPNPASSVSLDGAVLPMGQPVKSKIMEKTDLLYNEFIVYDIAQVNCKYLFRVKFNYIM